MGRIKSTLIKRTARTLRKESEIFNDKFGNNKEILGGDTMPSKRLRNRIAGYITRLIRNEQKKKALLHSQLSEVSA